MRILDGARGGAEVLMFGAIFLLVFVLEAIAFTVYRVKSARALVEEEGKDFWGAYTIGWQKAKTGRAGRYRRVAMTILIVSAVVNLSVLMIVPAILRKPG